ncbi:MAG TPA: hypothetical protein VHT26_04470 [Trebonia sp.]|nr:hypothetical protein [Trebonia sp.]
MLTAWAELDELAAPALTVACKFIVPVNEFALEDDFAASLTASSALTGAAEEDPLALAVELELAEQPVAAAATITASPAAYNGNRATLTCIKTSEARP